MNKELIKRILKGSGYFVSVSQNHVGVGKNPILDTELGITTFDGFCRVFENDGKICVDDIRYQLPREEFFNSEQEAIAFILKQFPLEP